MCHFCIAHLCHAPCVHGPHPSLREQPQIHFPLVDLVSNKKNTDVQSETQGQLLKYD